MARPLYTAHKTALSTLYSEVDGEAAHMSAVFIGTAGSIIKRTNASGMRFYTHQYYDSGGKKKERYVAGPVGKKEADEKARELQDRVDATRALSSSTRLLAREGYYMADARTYATAASLHNHGFFAAGARCWDHKPAAHCSITWACAQPVTRPKMLTSRAISPCNWPLNLKTGFWAY